jgi:hypothetical protein
MTTPLLRTVCLCLLCVAAAPALAQASACAPGARIEIEYHGSWKPGTVRGAPDAAGACLIAWDGYSAAWDERVPLTRIRLAGQAQTMQRLPPVEGALWPGNYVCTRAGGSISPAFGFTVHAGGRYTDHQGQSPGRYRIDREARTIAFQGGGWDGRSGRFGKAESVFTHYEGEREIVTCRPISDQRGRQ